MSESRYCLFMSFFSKVQFGPKCLGLEHTGGLGFFSWISLWEAFCCLHLKESIWTHSGLLQSALLVMLMLARDSREVESR